MNGDPNFDALLDCLRSGDAFAPGEPLGDDLASRLRAAVRDAARAGLMQAWNAWLFPAFKPRWVVAQACDLAGYDPRGLPQPATRLGGGIRVLANSSRLTVPGIESAVLSVFGRTNLLVPAENAIAVRPAETSGVVEVVLRSTRPLATHTWTGEQLDCDLAFFCADPAALGAYRTLGRGLWTFEGTRLWPHFGAPAPVDASEALRWPACRLLGRLQPPCADRFLRVPVRAVAAATSEQVRFRVRLDADAEGVTKALGDSAVRLNCVALWNAATGVVECEGRRLEVSIDPAPLRPVTAGVTVLECFNVPSGREWFDRRFAGDRDPADTFVSEPREGRPGPTLRFGLAPPVDNLRIVYLAGMKDFGEIAPGSQVVGEPGLSLFTVLRPCDAPEAAATLAAECPAGRVVSELDLLEYLYRIAPPAVRRNLDLSALVRGSAAVAVRQELRVLGDEAGGAGRASPVTVVVLPRLAGRGEDLGYWLECMAREAERACAFGDRLVVRCEPVRRERRGP